MSTLMLGKYSADVTKRKRRTQDNTTSASGYPIQTYTIHVALAQNSHAAALIAHLDQAVGS
jgi:hypothetical protein